VDGLDGVGRELAAGRPAEPLQRLVQADGGPVRAVGGDRVEGVDGANTRAVSGICSSLRPSG
jgi:hypothetical protein